MWFINTEVHGILMWTNEVNCFVVLKKKCNLSLNVLLIF